MNKKEFKQAMLKGQGRCIQAVKVAPERYRAQVLWACSRVISFDTQCEGSKAWYVYQMISCYEDRSDFLRTVIETLEKIKSNGRWKLLYLAELLKHFEDDGYSDAHKALWNIYEKLFQNLFVRKRRPSGGFFPELDDFEKLCVRLADKKLAVLKIAEDIGTLYRCNPIYDEWDFAWLAASIEKRHISALDACAVKAENVQFFLENIRKYHCARECRDISRRQKNEKANRVQERLTAYRNETDSEKRAAALDSFWFSGFPEDPTPVMKDTRSDCERLRNTAWNVLRHTRNPLLRPWAKEQINENPEDSLSVFIANAEPEDEKTLLDLIRSIPVDFECTTIWHSVQLDILNMEDFGIAAPLSLLQYIYESTYCSCCRRNAVRQMGKRRLLTRDMLEECLYDSQYDTRSYASRLLRRRKQRL